MKAIPFFIMIGIYLFSSCKYAYIDDYTGEYNFELYTLAFDGLGVTHTIDTISCLGVIEQYHDGDEENATTPIEPYVIAPDKKAWLTISYNNWTLICHVDETGEIEPYSYGTGYSHSGEFTDQTHLLVTTFWGGLGSNETIEVHGEKILDE